MTILAARRVVPPELCVRRPCARYSWVSSISMSYTCVSPAGSTVTDTHIVVASANAVTSGRSNRSTPPALSCFAATTLTPGGDA